MVETNDVYFSSNDFKDALGVTVPPIELDVNEQEIEYLQSHFDSLQRSDYEGVDIYEAGYITGIGF